MTALLDARARRPGEVFTAPGYDALPAESSIDLAAGERMTVARPAARRCCWRAPTTPRSTLADGISGSTRGVRRRR